jgi:hypothetical protein
MELIVNGDVQENPASNAAISEAIGSLAGNEDGFVILASSQMSYLQTTGGPRAGRVLEYQQGSPDEHYACTTPGLGTEDVIRTFQRYLAGDDRWRTDLTWVRENLAAAAGSSGVRIALLGGGAAALLLLLWVLSAA